MVKPLRPTLTSSISASLRYSGLTGFALSVVHQIYSSFSMQIPENVYTHVVGASLFGAISGAVLFSAIASLRNRIMLRG